MMGERQRRLIKSRGFQITTSRSELCRCRSNLTKQSGRIKRHLITHDVITSTGQLVREGIHGEYWITLCSLPLVKALGRGQILDRKVRRLEERPGQIWIAIFPIILAFFFSLLILLMST